MATTVKISQQQIEKALADELFTLYYQPKVSLVTGQISGAEALIRWPDEENGFISPDRFIPLAEEKGLITNITAQILPIAIDAAQNLRSYNFSGSIAVNVSPLDLNSPLISCLFQDYLTDKRMLPKDIQIELTETAMVENHERIIKHLHDLVSMGISLTMDDFGTGHSSMDLLSQLPFSAIKIDQGVIRRMAVSPKNLNIVRMSINMARTLKMHTVAEGIENANSYRFVAYSGCLEAQGYWLSQPLPLAEFRALLESHPRWPSTHLGMIYHAQLNNIYFRKSVFDAIMFASTGISEAMQSVTNPDIEFRPEHTRLGAWYYGMGQA